MQGGEKEKDKGEIHKAREDERRECERVIRKKEKAREQETQGDRGQIIMSTKAEGVGVSDMEDQRMCLRVWRD